VIYFSQTIYYFHQQTIFFSLSTNYCQQLSIRQQLLSTTIHSVNNYCQQSIPFGQQSITFSPFHSVDKHYEMGCDYYIVTVLQVYRYGSEDPCHIELNWEPNYDKEPFFEYNYEDFKMPRPKSLQDRARFDSNTIVYDNNGWKVLKDLGEQYSCLLQQNLRTFSLSTTRMIKRITYAVDP